MLYELHESCFLRVLHNANVENVENSVFYHILGYATARLSQIIFNVINTIHNWGVENFFKKIIIEYDFSTFLRLDKEKYICRINS